MAKSAHGRHKIDPKVGKRTQFTSDKQPPNEQKRAGMLRKKRGTELAKAILELSFKGTADGSLRKAVAQYYGVAEKEITVEMMIMFRQIEKAIQKADTVAAKMVMERGHGMPTQQMDITTDGEPLQITRRIIGA